MKPWVYAGGAIGLPILGCVLLLQRGEIGVLGLLMLFVGAVLFYLIPTAIAAFRSKLNVVAIAIVNLTLGWTLVGWVTALVWAVSNPEIVEMPVGV